MTPFLTKTATIALSDSQNTQAWMIAALTRAKKFPKLQDMISRKPEKADMETGLKTALQSALMAKQKRK